jgi:hypothetical protein
MIIITEEQLMELENSYIIYLLDEAERAAFVKQAFGTMTEDFAEYLSNIRKVYQQKVVPEITTETKRQDKYSKEH